MMLTLNQAEKFVDSAPSAAWNGWTLEIFLEQPNAYLRQNGTFHNGKWALKTSINPNEEGHYVISKRNAAIATKSWN